MEKKLDCLAGNLATLFGKTFFFFKDICGGYRFSLLKFFLLSMYSFSP